VKQQGTAYHFLGLNAADTNARARAFLKQYGWTWPSIRDPQRTLAHRPAVLLIDAQGRYVAGFEGAGTPVLWNALKRKLRTQ